MTASEWNERNPVGTPVRYFPVKGEWDHVDSETRSIAWDLYSGTPVVKIKGRVGGVALGHLLILSKEDGK